LIEQASGGAETQSVIAKTSRRLAEMQSVRFVVVGGFNTVFGVIDTFVLLKLLLWLRPDQPKTMGTVAMAGSSVINIAFSFLTYKWFVFRTKGNYLKEYLRSLTIYLPSLALNTFLVAPLAAALKRWTGREHASVYVAMGIILTATIVFSFFGHKRVTFRQDGNASGGPAA
jgi:putative flippase GtrA